MIIFLAICIFLIFLIQEHFFLETIYFINNRDLLFILCLVQTGHHLIGGKYKNFPYYYFAYDHNKECSDLPKSNSTLKVLLVVYLFDFRLSLL